MSRHVGIVTDASFAYPIHSWVERRIFTFVAGYETERRIYADEVPLMTDIDRSTYLARKLKIK